jgi:Ca2+:H+ antiporter
MAMADALSSLMIITATALILPTALYSFMGSDLLDRNVLSFSRGSAVVLLVLYLMYLYFQLGTHPHFFIDAQNDGSNTGGEGNVAEEQPSLSLSAATITLITATIGIVGCARLFLKSVPETADVMDITETFIAAIIIPIASNAPECSTIVIASQHGRINFAIGVIVSSILQIALFVIPFLVVLGWIIGEGLDLYFQQFQTTILFLAVLVVNRLLQDEKYTYVQGAMLVAL